MNKLKNNNAKKKAKRPGSKVKTARKYIKVFNVFSLIKKEDFLQIMPFIFFITFLAIIYIK